MKQLTIIIPVYNNPRELKITINSILRQSFPIESIEILVVDDGSDVDMETTLEEFTAKIAIRYFYQEDMGFRPGTARNTGIRAANGKVCVFLDCGVIVTSNCFQEHMRLHHEHGPTTVVIGYIYGNDTHSDLKEMKDIIDSHLPDESAKIMKRRLMLDGREKLYSITGDDITQWPAPWVALWSLHFSVQTAFMRDKEIYFDEYFSTWGSEDCDFGIQLQNAGAIYVLARAAMAIHYPPEIRSYDKLKQNQGFHENFKKNQQYVVNKYPNNTAVKLWAEKGFSQVNKILMGK